MSCGETSSQEKAAKRKEKGRRAGKVKETSPKLRKHTLAQRETWREPLLEFREAQEKAFK